MRSYFEASPKNAHTFCRPTPMVRTCRRLTRSLQTFAVVWLAIAAWQAPHPAFAAPQVFDYPRSSLKLAGQSRALVADGRTGEALRLSLAALRMAEREYGSKHAYVAYILDDIARLYATQHQYGVALSYGTRALEVVNQSPQRGTVKAALVAASLAATYAKLGRYRETASMYDAVYPLLKRKLGVRHRQTAEVVTNLALANLELSRLGRAQQLFLEAIESKSALYGTNSLPVAELLTLLARCHIQKNDLVAADRAASRAERILSMLEEKNVAANVNTAVVQSQLDIERTRFRQAEERLLNASRQLADNGLSGALSMGFVESTRGYLELLRGYNPEAEQAYKESLRIFHANVAPTHPLIAHTLHNLAYAYAQAGQHEKALNFYTRAQGLAQYSFGEIDATVAVTRYKKGEALAELGEYRAALEAVETSLSIYRALPEDRSLNEGHALLAKGHVLRRLGETARAREALTQALRLISRKRGQSSPYLPRILRELAEVAIEQGRFDDAQGLIERALLINESNRAGTPGELAKTLWMLARIYRAQNKWHEGLAAARRSIKTLSERVQYAGASLSLGAMDEIRDARELYEFFLDLADEYRKQGPNETAKLTEEMFIVAQYPHLSNTAAAVSRMAARFEPADPSIERLIRKRQDAVESWRGLDNALSELLISPGQKPTIGNIREKSERLNAIGEVIQDADRRLREQFPEYVELARPLPTSVAQVQRNLNQDEALLLHVAASQRTFLFLVKRDGLTVGTSPMNASRLASTVERVREGLDIRAKTLPAFDVEAARYLYQRLIAPVADALDGVTHVLFVPDRAMQSLPITVLVASTPPTREASEPHDFEGVDFVGRRYAFSVLPAVSTFDHLRRLRQASPAPESFVGFGDPDFEARSRQNDIESDAALAAMPRRADARRLQLPPLPETRHELASIAASLGGSRVLYFGSQATEAKVKSLDLARYRVVAFATHALLAGEGPGLSEPALVMSTPSRETDDDGLLTASEIASLKLNADWVILSACNTAGTDGRPGAEGLSGLARAFFFAGTRSLLVSHWWIASDTGAHLTRATIGAFTRDPGIGRAEALRRAMTKLMQEKAHPVDAHPAYWAPFVVVGDGGRQG